MDPVLAEGLRCLGAENTLPGALLNDRLEGLLNKYIQEIELFNPAYGLVGTGDRRELVVRHILDSLAPLGLIRGLLEGPPEAVLADVGSGAGLPGIPLAIALPERPVTLIERKGRRAAFLRNTQAVLALPNVTVEEGPMEQAPPGRFRALVFRAFRPLDRAVLRALFRLLEPGGVLAAYKGRRAAVEAELGGLTDASWEALPVPVPFLEEERHLVVIRPRPGQEREGEGSGSAL
ncbi:MAG: 16S rRNA (guanine(527)-N(7))-methyltransferase RsmG [Spirochaetaceae bacterium]|jgi:16S rRNA (guanine527-N7)-methyltransferase|nr:16S rRNA (guanine(527)-N(7))-methyltransferase RsmG [Spirochaetaceae bacterium]